jgi:DNA repair protein RadC
LTDAELIAILIGSGNRNETAVDLSKRILAFYDNNLTKLGKASIQDLSKFKGIGEAKAISIVAALELGLRRRETQQEQLTRLPHPAMYINTFTTLLLILTMKNFGFYC